MDFSLGKGSKSANFHESNKSWSFAFVVKFEEEPCNMKLMDCSCST